MRFFVGIHQPCDAHRFPAVFVSVNRLAARKSDFRVGDWIMDSGAFTLINKHGHYPEPPEVYAERINRWAGCGNMLAAVSQDYMCEPFVLAKTGLTVAEHQRLTIERYDAIRSASQAYVMPVLQGYQPEEYVSHLGQYGDRIARGQWVGVGSVCKRNSNPEAIVRVLGAILDERPDLKLHGFGVKSTALADGRVWRALHSADSMAWSFAARKQGRGGNAWQEAERYREWIETRVRQPMMFV